MSEEAYDALDAGLEAILRLVENIDMDRVEKLIEVLPKIEKLLGLLNKLDDDTLEALEKIVEFLPVIFSRIDEIIPCIENTLEEMNKAEPVNGLRGLLGILRDKEVQVGLGKAVAILRALGKCNI